MRVENISRIESGHPSAKNGFRQIKFFGNFGNDEQVVQLVIGKEVTPKWWAPIAEFFARFFYPIKIISILTTVVNDKGLPEPGLRVFEVENSSYIYYFREKLKNISNKSSLGGQA